jgi:hypothetical protein
MPTYEHYLAKRKPHRLLEIGIGYENLMAPFVPFYVHGASLKMWTTYWPEAHIFACDIREDTLINEGNIRSWVVDQGKEHDLNRLVANCGSKLDVIIDDGSHVFEHQKLTARMLLPWLMKGGVYFIEDTYPDKGAEMAEMFGGTLIVGDKRPDDCLVVIQR